MNARPLDVLYVGTLPPHRGGSAIAMAQVLSGLAGRGHRIRAVAPITAEQLREGDRFAERAPELTVRRFVLPYLDGAPDVPPSDEYRELKRGKIAELMAQLIAERRPDVVIAGRESFVSYVPDVAQPHGLPVVAYAHGTLTHGLLNGTYPRELAEGLVDRLRGLNALVTPARHLAASLARLRLPSVRVVRNAVDPARFHPHRRDGELARRLGVGEDDVVAAHLSNLKPVKRPLDIVAAAALALARDPRLLFLVVGDGPMRAEVEEACRAAGVEERFRFVGWVEHEDVPAYLSLADILVLPSAAEAQALVYLEAHATGPTLIASDIPAAREVIVDGETGLLFPMGDVDAFAAAIVHAAADPELRAAVGRAARARVQAHALPEVVAEHERLLAATANGSSH
jgi:1,2-diacylglycerol 3-alpha-glucosyltransferase